MKRAFLKRAGGGEHGAILDVIFLDRAQNGFEQQIVTIQANAVDFLNLRSAEDLGQFLLRRKRRSQRG